MRFHLLGLILLAGVSTPALAQRDSIDRRIDRLEQEMRAVQRRVFPGGAERIVEPEIRAPEPGAPAGMAAGDALSGLTARVDALEDQLRTITGQTEENSYRLRQLEEQVNSLRTDMLARLDRLERQAAQPAPAPFETEEPRAQAEPAAAEPERAETAGAAPATAADPAEEAYNAGYRVWDAGRYREAQQALEAVAERHKDSRWASWARNLAGRAYLDDGKPASAARLFLANYQENPRGERAADSLYFLGIALTQLDRKAEACRVYDELAEVYPDMRPFLRQRLPAARAEADCG